jgi:hypothetical protein
MHGDLSKRLHTPVSALVLGHMKTQRIQRTDKPEPASNSSSSKEGRRKHREEETERKKRKRSKETSNNNNYYYEREAIPLI